MLADEMKRPINLPTVAATAREIESLGKWDGASVAAPTVALLPAVSTTGEHAVLESWRLLLDLGTLQQGEENLAGTARPSTIVISAKRAAELGVVDGDHVAVKHERGSITLPVAIGDIADNSVWVPRNSIGSQSIVTFGAGRGVLVTVVKA